MLHGCTQSPDDFAAGTRMNAARRRADLPRRLSRPDAVPPTPQKCWNWFNAADQQRDQGEPALIAGITRQVMRDYAVDPAAGLCRRPFGRRRRPPPSWGDLSRSLRGDRRAFRSRLRGGAATCPRRSPPCGRGTAAQRAGRGRGDPAGSRRIVPTIVFHGDQDTTVHPAQRRPGHRAVDGATANARDTRWSAVRCRGGMPTAAHSHRREWAGGA